MSIGCFFIQTKIMHNSMGWNILVGIMTGSGQDDMSLTPNPRTEAFLFATMFKFTEAYLASHPVLTVDSSSG
jgi:hypothetical protein